MEIRKVFCVIAIRGIQWDSSGIFIGSGCGIVEKKSLTERMAGVVFKKGTCKKDFSTLKKRNKSISFPSPYSISPGSL